MCSCTKLFFNFTRFGRNNHNNTTHDYNWKPLFNTITPVPINIYGTRDNYCPDSCGNEKC